MALVWQERAGRLLCNAQGRRRTMLLECSGLKKSYGRKLAVRDMTLNLEQGKIYGLLGPNGSGKTTWMKMVAGLVKDWDGSIRFEGHPLTYKDKAEIAYMSTEPFFYSYMKIRDVGKYYADFFKDFSLERFEELLVRMDLDPNDKARTLSSGMAAKLKLAATLARDAKLYLLDEPLNGIDLVARDHVMQTIGEVCNPKHTIVMSTHLVDEIEPVIDGAIFVREGQIETQGSVEELRQKYGCSIVDLYRKIYG